MEKDDKIKGEGNSYTTEFRQYDPRVGRWLSIDPKANAQESPYVSMSNNPIMNNDVLGDTVWVFSTTLPGAPQNMVVNLATHTFIVVKTTDEVLHYFAYGPADHSQPLQGSQLIRITPPYTQDKKIYTGEDTQNLKEKLLVPVPDNMTQEEFDQKVIDVANSFGNNSEIEYDAITQEEWTGNCHSSTSTILSKAGVSDKEVSNLEGKISGFNWGFGDTKPWTSEEQSKAISTEKETRAKGEKDAKKEQDKSKLFPMGPNKL